MVKKQIQKHDFLSGGPVLQYVIPFIADDTITIGNITNHHRPVFSMVDNDGNNIFNVNEEQINWMGRNLVTEERLIELIDQRIALNNLL